MILDWLSHLMPDPWFLSSASIGSEGISETTEGRKGGTEVFLSPNSLRNSSFQFFWIYNSIPILSLLPCCCNFHLRLLILTTEDDSLLFHCICSMYVCSSQCLSWRLGGKGWELRKLMLLLSSEFKLSCVCMGDQSFSDFQQKRKAVSLSLFPNKSCSQGGRPEKTCQCK